MPIRAINIFRAGTFQDAAGTVRSFTENKLRTTVAAYNAGGAPRANVVLGHPVVERADETAGPIAALAMAGDRLYAIADISPRFVDLVRRKLFKHVSASFFGETHPENPVPGVSYLRHVGLLGAVPPAVAGLEPLNFSDPSRGAVQSFAHYRRARVDLQSSGGVELLPSGEVELIDFADGGTAPGFAGVLEATERIPDMSFNERMELAAFVDRQAARGWR